MTDAGNSDAHELPRPLRENLYVVVEALSELDGLFVALDFDGTLAAIESRPDEATIPDSTRETVATLAAEPSVEVAVVSGRELSDVRERVGLPELSYAGNHGLEMHTDEYVVHPVASEAEETISEIVQSLREELAAVEGVVVEDKGVTATVHHRLVEDADVPKVESAVETLVDAREDVRLTTGKAVLELRPAVEWDKGEATRQLRDELVPDDEEWFAAYLGDDTTDEAAFAVLGERGLAVKVGEDPDTAAAFRVADTEAVRAVLSWLGEYGVGFLHADHGDVSVESG